MSLFKIKIIPVVKSREWEVKNIGAGRKEKTCDTCGKTIRIGLSSTTFTKRTTKGSKTSYETIHTCHLFAGGPACATALSKKLKIDLYESMIN